MVIITDFPTSEVLVFTLPDCARVATDGMAVELHFIVPSGRTEDAVNLVLKRASLVIIIVTIFERLNVRVVADDDFDGEAAASLL